MKVDVKRTPDRRFDEVASLIAKGLAPEWLVSALELFSGFVGSVALSADQYDLLFKKLQEMKQASDLLIRLLPLFEHLPIGDYPPDVAVALNVLPSVRDALAKALRRSSRRGGPRPNVPRKVCAAIVIEAWSLLRGKPEPRSNELYKACDLYWLACGQPRRGNEGDIENWRRDVEEAVDGDTVWIRNLLTGLAVHN